MRLRASTIIKYVFILFIMTPSMNRAQKIDYFPIQKENVSDGHYEYAIHILEETYDYLKKHNGVFKFGNYWNLAIAYNVLKENPKDVKGFLLKSKSLNPSTFAYMFSDPDSRGINFWKDALTILEYEELYKFSIRQLELEDSLESISEESDEFNNDKYESELLSLISEIYTNDSKYRMRKNLNMDLQKKFDNENLIKIDSLFKQYKTYIGVSLVGEKYATTMWAVIQHSNIDKMEEYLPIIYEGVKNKELEEGALKLLIDRIYSIREGAQVYGSQVGVPFLSKEKINCIKSKYAIIGKKKKKLNKWLNKE